MVKWRPMHAANDLAAPGEEALRVVLQKHDEMGKRIRNLRNCPELRGFQNFPFLDNWCASTGADEDTMPSDRLPHEAPAQAQIAESPRLVRRRAFAVRMATVRPGKQRQKRQAAPAAAATLPDLPDLSPEEYQRLTALGGVECKHRGINIQRPWAGLILDGIKDIEARAYEPKGYSSVTLWIIETPGKKPLSEKTAEELASILEQAESLPSRIVGAPPLKGQENAAAAEAQKNTAAADDSSPRCLNAGGRADGGADGHDGCAPAPKRGHRGTRHPTPAARIVGTVEFIGCKKYETYEEWRKDAERHRVPKGSEFDWQSGPMYGWEVGSVKRLLEPQPGPKQKGMIGSRAVTRMAVFDQ